MSADDFESLRLRLPLDDPDRHDLDTVADEAFAHLAPGYPNTCNPADFARSVADGFEEPVEWGPAPVYPPRPQDVETGGAL